MVEKIVDTIYKDLSQEPNPAVNGNVIQVKLNDFFAPYVLGTNFCEEVVIWWSNEQHKYNEQMYVCAVQHIDDETSMKKVKEWNSVEMIEALRFVHEELV